MDEERRQRKEAEAKIADEVAAKNKAARDADKELNSKLLQAARPVRRAATTAKRDLFPVRV